MATSNNDRISSAKLATFAAKLWTKIKNTFAKKDDLAEVATSGSYGDLSDKPPELFYCYYDVTTATEIEAAISNKKTPVLVVSSTYTAVKGYYCGSRNGIYYFESADNPPDPRDEQYIKEKMWFYVSGNTWSTKNVPLYAEKADRATIADSASSVEWDDVSDKPKTLSSNDFSRSITKGQKDVIWAYYIPSDAWEQLIDMDMATNAHSSLQLKVLISIRVGSNGDISGTRCTVIMPSVSTSALGYLSLETVKDSSNKMYLCMCINHNHSSSSRTLRWNVRTAKVTIDNFYVAASGETLSDYGAVINSFYFNNTTYVKVLSDSSSSTGHATTADYADLADTATKAQALTSRAGSIYQPCYIDSEGRPKTCEIWFS